MCISCSVATIIFSRLPLFLSTESLGAQMLFNPEAHLSSSVLQRSGNLHRLQDAAVEVSFLESQSNLVERMRKEQ